MDDPTPADVPLSAGSTAQPAPLTGATFPPRRDLTDGVVLLRQPVRSDGVAIIAGASDPDVVRFTRVPSPYGPDDLDAILSIAVDGWQASTDAVFGVCDASEPDELLGLIGLHGVELTGDPGGVAEIGYWTRPAGRGRGLTTRAVVLASRWAFDELGLAVIEWCADTRNPASRRIAEKAGYVVSGVRRRGMLHRDRRVDVWFGSLLPGELVDVVG
jgi:RimJ/RimL family protein N-acetyltransferase